jgi:hypothetical protein
MKKILLTLLHLLFLTILMFGQVARKETLALRIDEEIIINGLLDEMIWKKAPEAGAFVYEQPDRKDPKTIFFSTLDSSVMIPSPKRSSLERSEKIWISEIRIPFTFL